MKDKVSVPGEFTDCQQTVVLQLIRSLNEANEILKYHISVLIQCVVGDCKGNLLELTPQLSLAGYCRLRKRHL